MAPLLPCNFICAFRRYPLLSGSGDNSFNVVMGWQGHERDETLYKIASTGAVTTRKLRNVGVDVKDDGWYGSGINFTQWPRYVKEKRPEISFRP